MLYQREMRERLISWKMKQKIQIQHNIVHEKPTGRRLTVYNTIMWFLA